MYGFPDTTGSGHYETRDRLSSGLPVPRTMTAQASVPPYRPHHGASHSDQWAPYENEADAGDVYRRQSTPIAMPSGQHAQRRPPIPPVYRDGEG
jgi:hypothetical protein